MKTCSKCGGEPKPLTEFRKEPRARDGLRSECRVCSMAAAAKWNAANPDKVKEQQAKWYAANTEKNKARGIAYRADNPEKVKAQSAKRYADNPEKMKASSEAWRKANPERVRQNRRIQEQNHRARKRTNGGRLSPGLSAKLFKLQRGKCACCHVSIADGNHLDHVIPVALNGPNEDWNMQLLCGPCNTSKGAKHPVDFMQQRGFLL